MNYNELLNKIIKDSGLMNIEIINKMKEEGVSITATYLSVLRNDKTKIASEDVSKAIAKVCGAKEELLVVQGELDKANGMLKEFIEFAMETITYSTRVMIDKLPDEQLKAMAKAKFENLSDADIICDIVENKEDYRANNVQLFNLTDTPQEYAIVPIAKGGKVKIVNKIEGK